MRTGLVHPHTARHAHHGGLAGNAVIGIVTNNSDPDGMSRVKVKFPTLSDRDESFWARVAVPMAGNAHGVRFPLAVDDEVLVIFSHLREPYVIGALWNGQDQPPTDDNHVNVIQTRSGHVVKLDDTDGKEMVAIVDRTGNNSIVIDTSSNTVTISADGDIVLSAPNGAITMSAKKITVDATNEGDVHAGAGGMTVRADGDVFVKGKTVNLN